MFSSLIKELGKELRCPICLDNFDVPICLPCSHHFCEECIGQCLKGKSECPLCRIPVSKRSIWKNNKLESILSIYESFIKLQEETKNNQNNPQTNPNPSPTDNSQKRNRKEDHHPSPKENVNIKESGSPQKKQKTKKEDSFVYDEAVKEKPSTSVRIPDSLPSSRIKKPVILCTGLGEDYLKTVKTLCKKHGGKVTNTFTNGVTHVVTQACTTRNETRRTLKYLQGVLTGKWVVNYDWIERSTDKWVKEDLFEIKGDVVSGKGGPKRSRTNKGDPLFMDVSFFFWGKMKTMPAKELKKLVRLGGGTVLEKISDTEGTVVIVDSALSLSKKQDLEETLKVSSALDFKWILDCAGSYEIREVNDY